MEEMKIKRIFKRIGAAVLCVGILVIGVLAVCFAGYTANENVIAENNIAEAGTVVVNTNKSNGISLTGSAVKAEGEEYESYYEVIATVNNTSAKDISITWSIAWSDDTDDTLTDYLTLSSASSDSGEAITVYCYGAFSTQAILTATANGGENVTAEATVDYVARANGFMYISDVSYSDANAVNFISYNYLRYALTQTLDTEMFFSSYSYDEDTENETGYLKIVSGTGTMEETYSDCTFTISLTSAGITALGYDASISVNVSESQSLTMIELLYGLFNGCDYSIVKSDISSFTEEDIEEMQVFFYDLFYSLYEDYTALLNIEFSCTGDITGETFTFSMNVLVDLSGYAAE